MGGEGAGPLKRLATLWTREASLLVVYSTVLRQTYGMSKRFAAHGTGVGPLSTTMATSDVDLETMSRAEWFGTRRTFVTGDAGGATPGDHCVF